MLKINAENNNIGEVLRMFSVYKEYQYFHKQEASKSRYQISKDGIPCYSVFDGDKIDNDPSDLIFIDNLSEGINWFKYFKKLNKNKKYVIFSNGWWDTEYYDCGIEYTLVLWHTFLYDYIHQFTFGQHINYFANKEYEFEEYKPNIFCALIGKSKPERTALVDKLLDIQFPCLMIYNGKELKGSLIDHDLNFDFSNLDFCKNIGKTCEYTVSRSVPIDIYNSSRFNLIIETNSDVPREFHLTEKTIKSLLTGIPFVLMAGAGYLEKLKEMGFKTYDKLWSEEYDNIEDFDIRSSEVSRLVKSLNSFNWTEHTNDLKAIAQHNRTVFAYSTYNLMKHQLDCLDEVLLNLSNQGY